MSAFTEWLAAFSAAVSAAAGYWAYRTADRSHSLALALAEKAETDSYELEEERMALAAAEARAEASRLWNVAVGAKTSLASAALKGGSYGNSRIKNELAALDETIATAESARADAEKAALGEGEPKRLTKGELRAERIRLQKLCIGMRTTAESLLMLRPTSSES